MLTATLIIGIIFHIITYHNLYQPDGVIAVQPLAIQFIDCVISARGQKIILDDGVAVYGQGLYNGVDYAWQYDH